VAAVRFFGSKLYVWDPALGRVTAFDVDGDGFEELSPAVTGATDIEILSEEAIAFAGSMFTREAAGFPLHVVEKSDPTMVIHTGVGQAAWNAAEPWGQVVHSALGPDRKVWLARQPRLEFREWSEAGGVERIASGEPDWFPPVVDIPRQGEVPRTRLDDFVVDDAGRIWVLTRVAGANWRAGLGGTSEGGLPGLIDRAVYADHRVDVFDLAEAKHAGHVLVDNPMTHMLLIDGEAHVAHVTYDAAFTPRLSVSRLSVDAR
jgi:hypothetical protein